MKSIEILNKINKNKKEHIFTKTDNMGNTISVVNKVAESANEEELQYVTNVCQIPSSYVKFLSIYNGARLFDYDGIDGLQLLSSKAILHYTQYAKNTFEEEWDDEIIIFAKIIGEDNYLGFKTLDKDNENYVVLDCCFEVCPKEWRIIETSFDEFLSKYLLSNGDKFWVA
ncbi:MAG: SMI1/KNR4 family protein [Bacteroidales bacterium]|nr:SMI1/KNR4 family protein [Lachnoclostridium sp.]MCM1385480.1 SMI1/KNR4 family protein [Lachnoclostridium sp.]MCM1466204.1 SMI1/KNR4 family protein [Bacteroidales bacterium]